ncbi:hypothetical protein HDV00_011469 [Rhizophlyctis rosea]|nr:hypothetical protein HDV00_011469 [Rhizophlyctis rosea]
MRPAIGLPTAMATLAPVFRPLLEVNEDWVGSNVAVDVAIGVLDDPAVAMSAADVVVRGTFAVGAVAFAAAVVVMKRSQPNRFTED